MWSRTCSLVLNRVDLALDCMSPKNPKLICLNYHKLVGSTRAQTDRTGIAIWWALMKFPNDR